VKIDQLETYNKSKGEVVFFGRNGTNKLMEQITKERLLTT